MTAERCRTFFSCLNYTLAELDDRVAKLNISSSELQAVLSSHC